MQRSASIPTQLILLASLWILTPNTVRGENRVVLLERAVSSISADELQSHVDVLADDQFEGREAGSRGGAAAGVYIMKELARLGLKPAGENDGYFQDFHGGRNILAMLPGNDPKLKDEFALVGGHYDHVGYGSQSNSYGPFGYVHNGADDNASGVAGVLEVAEAMVESGMTPKRTIIFAFWDGEENGLVGSEYFGGHPTIPLGQLAMAFNVDMIGNLRDNNLEVFGVRSAPGLRRLISTQNIDPELKLQVSWELKANSDHHSFLSRNIPTLMFHTGLHDRYHRPSDDAHTVNREGMEKVSRFLVRCVAKMADHERLSYRRNSRFETEDHRRGLELPTPTPQPRIGLGWSREGDQLVVTHAEGAAYQAGFQIGDRIEQYQGETPLADDALRLELLYVNEPTKWSVQRSEETVELTIQPVGPPSRIGITWRQDTADPSMAVVTLVRVGSAAELAGVAVGDRIIAIGGEEFQGTEELFAKLTKSPAPIRLLLERDGRVRETQMNPLPARD